MALARPSSMVASRVLGKFSGPQALLSSADFCRLKEGLHWGLQKDICQKYHVTNGLHDLAFGIPEWSFRQQSRAPQKRAVKSPPLQAALQVRVAGGTALGAARALARPRLQSPPAGPQALPEGRAQGTGSENMWSMNGSVAQAREQLCLALSGSASFEPNHGMEDSGRPRLMHGYRPPVDGRKKLSKDSSRVCLRVKGCNSDADWRTPRAS